MQGLGLPGNDAFMDAAATRDAAKGLHAMTRIRVLPGVRLYRFASAREPGRFFARPWWVGWTPLNAIARRARASLRQIHEVARECLAVDWNWSEMDTLVSVRVVTPLDARMGTPRTQAIRERLLLPAGLARSAHDARRLEPDRTITQHYIAGLDRGVCEDWVPGPGGMLVRGWRAAAEGERQRAHPLWRVALGDRQVRHLALLTHA